MRVLKRLNQCNCLIDHALSRWLSKDSRKEFWNHRTIGRRWMIWYFRSSKHWRFYWFRSRGHNSCKWNVEIKSLIQVRITTEYSDHNGMMIRLCIWKLRYLMKKRRICEGHPRGKVDFLYVNLYSNQILVKFYLHPNNQQ